VIADGDAPEFIAMDESGQTVEKAAWAGKTLRFRLSIPRGKIYAIEGLTLVDRQLPPKINPLKNAAWKPSPVLSHVSDFASSPQTWKGVDKVVAHDGYLTVSRAGRNPPFAYSSIITEQFMSSDWTRAVGGRGARITCRVRSEKPGGRVIIEVYAGDVGAWKFETQTTFSTDWQQATAALRYDWTDEEARAAGWTRAHDNGFPWHETITNVGKVVVIPSTAGAQTTFDLDDVHVSGVD
jgi:hypothetical protein